MAPYIWTELRPVLRGLTPTGVNKSLNGFFAPAKQPTFIVVVAAEREMKVLHAKVPPKRLLCSTLA